MAKIWEIIAVLLTAAAFGWGVPLSHLFTAFQSISSALAIMVAAVFVRLNRGMPSLEWKSLEPKERSKLTSQIYDLNKEYAKVIALNAFALILIVILTVIGKDATSLWPNSIQRGFAGLIGAAATLCILRMGYVVWRDIDIVRLQKHLIDGLASKEVQERQNKAADDKIDEIRRAGLKKIDVKPPKSWED